jgi:hypothetical protein
MKDDGATVRDPMMWYLPSSAREASDGSPLPSVPMKVVFDSRSRMTVSSYDGYSEV